MHVIVKVYTPCCSLETVEPIDTSGEVTSQNLWPPDTIVILWVLRVVMCGVKGATIYRVV